MGLTIAGGAALLLAFKFERGTVDVDAVEAAPSFDDSFRAAVRDTATELELPPDWLNDSVKGYADLLEPGFRRRRRRVVDFGRLHVYALARRDLILMKLFAMRPQDLEDLRELKPTAAEFEFVRKSLDRVARFRKDKALAMQLYLDQGGAR